MQKSKVSTNSAMIYQTKNGALELRTDFQKDTIWATQADIVNIFEIDQSVASRHIRNIIKEGELDEKSNMQKMHIANSDKPVTVYSLDIILAVGYRTNSGRAIHFRRWATGVLKSYITTGFVIHKKIVQKNLDLFIETIMPLLPSAEVMNPEQTLELVSLFSGTWISLDQYDKGLLGASKMTKKNVKLAAHELQTALREFRDELLNTGEATDIFGVERSSGNIEGIVGNIMQSFGGVSVYASLEEKAAYLLYFMVKNHPFVDGNKRCGAFAFVWFLNKVKLLNLESTTPMALTALTLLVAESSPVHKEQITQLIVSLISKK